MRLSIGFAGFEPLIPTLAMVRAAETAGLDGVWSAEHLGFHSAVVPSALYASATERVEIGLVGQGPISRHPGLLAMELRSLAELAPGRVRIQVGTGDPALAARLGDRSRQKLSRVEELVTALRRLLAGEELSGDYAGHRFENYAIGPVEPPVPIDVMAMRPRMLALAARIGDGVSLSTGASRAYLAEAVRAVEQALADADRDRSSFRIMSGALAVIAPTHEQAITSLMPMLSLFGGGALRVLAPDLFDPAELEAAGGDPEAEARLITPEIAPELAFVATPDTVPDTLAKYESTGIDELNLGFVTAPAETAPMLDLLSAGRRSLTTKEISG